MLVCVPSDLRNATALSVVVGAAVVDTADAPDGLGVKLAGRTPGAGTVISTTGVAGATITRVGSQFSDVGDIVVVAAPAATAPVALSESQSGQMIFWPYPSFPMPLPQNT